MGLLTSLSDGLGLQIAMMAVGAVAGQQSAEHPHVRRKKEMALDEGQQQNTLYLDAICNNFSWYNAAIPCLRLYITRAKLLLNVSIP